MGQILVKDLLKKYGSKTILGPINTSFEEKKTHALLGSSGCGKTTLLKILLKLVPPTEGSVSIDFLPEYTDPHQNHFLKMGYVIQEGGLFPHLTAGQNIALMARQLNWSEDQIQTRAQELCRLVSISPELLSRYPQQLSGGQRQRIGIIRALMLDPPLLFLDEPLGALDPLVRNDLQSQLKEVFSELKKTVIFVTHDIFEAAKLGDSVRLLDQGKILQTGTYSDLAKTPSSSFVKEFIQSQLPDQEYLV